MLSHIHYYVLLLYGALNFTLATNKKCFKLSADVVFAVDSSFSIRYQDYHRQLSFLKAVIDQFIINDNHIHVGVVSFGSSVRLDIKLNDFKTKRDLKEAVAKIQQMEGGTDTYKAIHFIRTVMYESENGGRPWAKKQLVLITDGLSSNSSATLLEASIARSVGIEVFSILVGEGTEDVEIRGVASDPKEFHIFRVENYEALKGIEHALSSVACQRTFHVPAVSDSKDYADVDEDDESNPSLVAFTACERNTADVVFLMDSSSSIWEPDFKRQIKFVEQVTSRFDLGKDAIRVGVVVYSDAPITLIDLSEEQTHQYVHHALSKAPYITGGTNTALAINHVRTSVLANGAARAGAAHVIVILSDGQSSEMEQTILEASRAHDEGVRIFAIGIGEETKASELMALASDPDDQFVFHVSDYKALSEIAELLAVKTCTVASSVAQQAVCPSLPTDVVFAYDTTSLSRHHHDYVINIISEVTQSRRLNNHDLRVGVMREASTDSSLILHDIDLTNHWDQSNFKTRLDPGSRTASMDILLRKARRKYFHPTIQFDDITHKRTIVLFLDSLLENRYGATLEAFRLRRSHVKIAVVTLGKHTDAREVKGLASTPHSLNIIKSRHVQVQTMHHLVSKVLSVLCQ